MSSTGRPMAGGSFSAAAGSGNNNWWVARFYTLDAADCSAERNSRPSHQIAAADLVARWHAHRLHRWIDERSGCNRWRSLHVFLRQGVKPRDITPQANVSVASFVWLIRINAHCHIVGTGRIAGRNCRHDNRPIHSSLDAGRMGITRHIDL